MLAEDSVHQSELQGFNWNIRSLNAERRSLLRSLPVFSNKYA